MRSAIAVAALTLLSGCPTQQQPTCDVATQVQADVLGRDPIMHCESLLTVDGGDDPSAWAAAQACVLQAVQRDRSAFTFVYDTLGGQAGLSGFRGTNNRLVVRQYAFAMDPSDPKHPRLSVHNCNERYNADNTALVTQAVDATAGCTPTVGKPCLTCNDPSTGSLLCGK